MEAYDFIREATFIPPYFMLGGARLSPEATPTPPFPLLEDVRLSLKAILHPTSLPTKRVLLR